MDFLTERAVLGSLTATPRVNVPTAPGSGAAGGVGGSSSGGGGLATLRSMSLPRLPSRNRSQSHAHSISLERTVSTKSDARTGNRSASRNGVGG